MFGERGNRSLFVKARLRPGVALPEVETAVGPVAAQLTRDPAAQFLVLVDCMRWARYSGIG